MTLISDTFQLLISCWTEGESVHLYFCWWVRSSPLLLHPLGLVCFGGHSDPNPTWEAQIQSKQTETQMVTSQTKIGHRYWPPETQILASRFQILALKTLILAAGKKVSGLLAQNRNPRNPDLGVQELDPRLETKSVGSQSTHVLLDVVTFWKQGTGTAALTIWLLLRKSTKLIISPNGC